MKIALKIAYDGTNYAGWQRQPNVKSVQEEIETALLQLFGQNVPILGASRTDAGVHANGQCATFELPKMPIPLQKLPTVVNSRLPSDIAVLSAKEVDPNFSARFDAISKTYIYKIYNSPIRNPLICRYAAFVPQNLNLPQMQQAAQHFVGTYDFSAFCASGSSAKTAVRTIFMCEVYETAENYETAQINLSQNEQKTSKSRVICIKITGNAFLYNMVRIIAGTLLYVGFNKTLDIPKIISSKNRANAGKTMPACGLLLHEILYD
ncbi:MAG: tRNA pseudouridine(38-40) synthase TruA [Firmicutes bacterium]|nr:tRNA pseudouridine(38-40) synthase TruA [Bacillota bacterium]